MKKYTEIKAFVGGDIDSAIAELNNYKEKGELAFIDFNGKKLYSDIDTLKSAYRKITGKTKIQFDRVQKKAHERYKKNNESHAKSIPRLTKEWIKKGNDILDEKYRENWAKCVPIRLGDLYKGMELDACLKIVNRLNCGCTLDEARTMIDNQGHSGMSFSLVCAMLRSFCDRGNEFVDYV
jgi:hypothetical protein